MLKVQKHGIILSPTDNEFEKMSVLNPGIYQEDSHVHVYYRAVEEDKKSAIGYAKTEGPLKIIDREESPIITREFDYEKRGIEDPRIVKIEDTYYLTYTAYDGINAMGAAALSKDLKNFEKKGIITPKINYAEYDKLIHCCDLEKLNRKYFRYSDLFAQLGVAEEEKRFLRDKDVVLFPRKIDGKFVMLHRIWPGIQIVYFDNWEDLTVSFWKDYLENLTDHIVLDPKHDFEANYIGAGAPPIETEVGWILIYHGVEETANEKIYHTTAALLQLDKPEIEISRLEKPLFSPTKDWEKEGEYNDVVFPTGTALFDKELYIYYGAADKNIAVASVNIDALIKELKVQS